MGRDWNGPVLRAERLAFDPAVSRFEQVRKLEQVHALKATELCYKPTTSFLVLILGSSLCLIGYGIWYFCN